MPQTTVTTLHLLVGMLAVIVVVALRYFSSTVSTGTQSPPGPKGLPLLGSLLEIPTGQQWLGYDAWVKKYGDMVYLRALRTPILVLGSSKRARDLLEKRSSICSDRPHYTMSYDLIGFGFLMNEMHYGDWWRRHRRVFHEFFHPGSITQYLPIQTAASHRLLQELLKDPDHFVHHIQHLSSATIMKITYGIDVSSTGDEYVALAEEATRIFTTSLLPGEFYVDFLPILKYVPSWMPGASFKRKAARWRLVGQAFLNRPFEAVKSAMIRGEQQTSVTAILISKLPDDEKYAEEEQVAKNVSAVAWAGGADTTAYAVQSFFLAMILYPDVQKRAQAELDAVIGTDRLPGFSDRSDLPYINAIVKEVMRWQPVTPLGAPHSTTEEQIYDGYYIPRGTVLLANCWTILHDPETYPDPEHFKPERFLRNGELDPSIPDPIMNGAFGFGRRICPGRHLTDNSLYSVVSSVLAAFDLAQLSGSPPSIDMMPGVLTYPVPFKCVITPRSSAAVALISATEEL